jgi:hypothetical protein
MLHSPDSTSSIAHALDIADARHWTRQPPKSDWARLRFLQARHTSIMLDVIENAYECGSLGSLVPTRSVSVPADEEVQIWGGTLQTKGM